MSWNSCPCVSDMRTPFDVIEPDFDLIALDKMANLNSDMFLDALELSGSMHSTLNKLAKILKKPQYDLDELSRLYRSVLDDLKQLARKEWEESL